MTPRLVARLLALFAAAAGGCATPRRSAWPADRSFDAGPLASRTVMEDGTERVRLLGPLFEQRREPDGRRLTAVRPFYARESDPASGWTHADILWPLASAKSLKERQASWRAGLVYYQRFDDDPNGRWRLWALPFYFQGRDAQGRRYAALFPVGGRIHEIFGQDETAFVLFPLYARSRIGEVKTLDLLWPILSKTEGSGIHRVRIFPLYGESRHREHYAKKFILWPFWTEARYDYPRSQGHGFVLFPFYGRIRLTDQRSDLFLPPLVRIDRSERIRAVSAPWPVFRRSRGEIRETTLWPIYRSRRRPGMSDGYVLWPIFRRENIDRGTTLIRRRKVLPIVQVETRSERHVSGDEDPPVTARDVRVWPLVSYRRDGDESRLRFPALWPTIHPRPVERSWAPLWTLAEHRADARHSETELLWGLFRRNARDDGTRRLSLFPLVDWERPPEGRAAWSVLKGLVGVRRRGSYTGVRLLYLFEWGVGEKEEDGS